MLFTFRIYLLTESPWIYSFIKGLLSFLETNIQHFLSLSKNFTLFLFLANLSSVQLKVAQILTTHSPALSAIWSVDKYQTKNRKLSPSLLPQLHLQALDLSVHDGELLRPETPLLNLLVQPEAEGTSQRWTGRWRWSRWWLSRTRDTVMKKGP